MAIVETRTDINLSEHNDTQIVARITLDKGYIETTRKIVWSCYEGKNDSGELLEGYPVTATISPGAAEASYVFNSLTPSTTYCITAIISNIQGIDGEIKYIDSQKTADSGGIEYPSNNPNIRRFYAKQTEKGKKSIECGITVNSLFRYNERTGALGIVSVTCQNEDGTIIGEAYYYSEIFGTEVKDTKYFSVPSFGIYTINLTATNIKDAPDQTETLEYKVKRTITVEVVDDIPNCILNCTFEDKIYSYDNGRVTGTIYNYPVIVAESWNQFCADINTVREKVGLESYGWFTDVSTGSPMTAELWRHIVYAIYAMDSSLTLPFVDVGYKITPEFISKIETDLQNIRDANWS
jgi:hypothetical protein